MREKYESLSASVLRELAKSRGIKGTSTLDESEAESKKAEEAAKPKTAAKAESEKTEKTERTTSVHHSRGSAEGRREHRSEHHDNVRAEHGEENAEAPVLEEPRDCAGILEIMQDGFGFIRSDNYLPGDNDVYVAPLQIRKLNLKTGDILVGKTRRNNPTDKFGALVHLETINGFAPEEAAKRKNFEDLTPIFPNERIRLEQPGSSVAGKTTLLKEIAKSVTTSYPDMHLIILLIDERPEEVTDIREAIQGKNVEVIYSTFDELPEHHKRVSEMVMERAKRLVEHKQDVMILMDSITRLARAYNLTVPPSGRTLSGGLDPAALHMPKKFFGAARNMREGGSLTILATALVDTGSKMDDVVFEEFKGTGNMEVILDRKLSEKRVFPAIDIAKSGTRRDDLLLDKEEQNAMEIMRRGLNGMRKDEAVESILNMFAHTRNNKEYIAKVLRSRMF